MKIVEYLDEGGESAFGEWVHGLDPIAAARIRVALQRIENGNESNFKGVGGGIVEWRIDYGPGYRLYMGRAGPVLIILLGGGTKKRQDRDIASALRRWVDYRERRSSREWR